MDRFPVDIRASRRIDMAQQTAAADGERANAYQPKGFSSTAARNPSGVAMPTTEPPRR
jgi:hypothetical protein